MYIPKNNSDHLNPIYIFCGTANDLLAAICRGDIDAKEMARKELRRRGYDENGQWAGFKQKESFVK